MCGFVFSYLRRCQEVLLSCYIKHISIPFEENYTFYWTVCTITLSEWAFLFSASLLVLGINSVFNYGHFNRCAVVYNYCPNLHFLGDIRCVKTFIYLFANCTSFSVRHLLRYLASKNMLLSLKILYKILIESFIRCHF